MMYNREQYRKLNDKKILHKKGKHWVVVSLALLGLISAGSAYYPASASTTAPTTTPTIQRNNMTNVQPQQSNTEIRQSPTNIREQPQHVQTAQTSQATLNTDENVARETNNLANQHTVQTPNINHQTTTTTNTQQKVQRSMPVSQQSSIPRFNNAQHSAIGSQRNTTPITHPTYVNKYSNNNARNVNNYKAPLGHPNNHMQEQQTPLHQGALTRHITQRAFNQAHPTIHKNISKPQPASAATRTRDYQILSHLDRMSGQLKRAVSGSSVMPHLAAMKALSNSVNTLNIDHKNMSTESLQSSSSSSNASSVNTLNKTLNENAWGTAPFSAVSNKSGSLKALLRANAWSSTAASTVTSADETVNSTDISSGQLAAQSSGTAKHMLGFIPYSANPDDVSGMVSNATSDEIEVQQIASAKGGYYAPSYAEQAQTYLSGLNTVTSDYNDLLSGTNYWSALGNSSKASSVSSAISAGNFATDHSTISTLDSYIAADDSQANALIADPNTEDSIQFVYKGQTVGSTTLNGKRDTSTVVSGNIPANYRLANDGTQNITFDGGNHTVDVLPNEDTDTINYFYNGKQMGSTTMQGIHGTQVTADGTNMPAGYRLAGDSTNTFALNNSVHNVDIIPITQPQQSTITVVFTDQAGHHITKTITGTSGQTGADVTQLAPVPSGYTLNSGQNTSYNFQNNPTSVNLQIMGIQQHFTVTVQVNRFDKNGVLIGTDQTTSSVIGRTGDQYTVDPNQFTPAGYQSESNPMSGSITSSGITNNTATFNYTKEDSSPITVLFFNQNGQQVATSTLDGLYGQTGRITTAPTGYSIKPDDNTGYTFTNSPQTIQVDLQGNNATSLPDNGNVRIMVEKMEDGRILNDTPEWIPVHGLVGDHYTIDPSKIAPAGFTAVSAPVQGTVTPSGLTNDSVKFIYVSDNSSTIAINYINQLGDNVGNGFMSGMTGNYVNITDPRQGGISIPSGYTLDDGQNTIYQFKHGVQVINLHVIGGPNANYDFNLQVVLRRPDGNGGWTTNGMFSKNVSVPESGSVGDTFSIDPNSPQITQQIPNYDQNFVPDSEDAGVNGTFNNGHLSQNTGTYYYNLVPGAQGAPVTVHYIHDGQTIDTQVFNGAPDQYLNLLSRVPSAYQAVNAGDYDSIMIGTKPQTVNIDLNANEPENNTTSSEVIPSGKVIPVTPATSTSSENSTVVASGASQSSTTSESSTASSSEQPTKNSDSADTNHEENSTGTITINYTNANTGLVIKPMTITGENGSLLDLSFYKGLVPDGYYIQNVPNPVGAFTNTNQTMRINVLPIGTAYSDGPTSMMSTATSFSDIAPNNEQGASVNNNSAIDSAAAQSMASLAAQSQSSTLSQQSNIIAHSSAMNSSTVVQSSVNTTGNTTATSSEGANNTDVTNVDNEMLNTVDSALLEGLENHSVLQKTSGNKVPNINNAVPQSAHMSDARKNYLSGEQDALNIAHTNGTDIARSRVRNLTPLVSRSYIRGYRAALGMPVPATSKHTRSRSARSSHRRSYYPYRNRNRRYGYYRGKKRGRNYSYKKHYSKPKLRRYRRYYGGSYRRPSKQHYSKARKHATSKKKAGSAYPTREQQAGKEDHYSDPTDQYVYDTTDQSKNKSRLTGQPIGKPVKDTAFERGMRASHKYYSKYGNVKNNQRSHTIRYQVSRPYLYGYLSDLNRDSKGKYPTAHSWGDGFLDGIIYTGKKGQNLYGGKSAAIQMMKSNPDQKYHNYVKGFNYALNTSSATAKKKSTKNTKQDKAPSDTSSDTVASDDTPSDTSSSKHTGVPNISNQNYSSMSQDYKKGASDFDTYTQNHTLKQGNKESHTIRYRVPKQYLFGYLGELLTNSNNRYPNANTWNRGFYDGSCLTPLFERKQLENYVHTLPNVSNAYIKGFSYATDIPKSKLITNTTKSQTTNKNKSKAQSRHQTTAPSDSDDGDGDTTDTQYRPSDTISAPSDIVVSSDEHSDSTPTRKHSKSSRKKSDSDSSTDMNAQQQTYYVGTSQDGYDDVESIIRKNGQNNLSGLNAARNYIKDLKDGNVDTKDGNPYVYPANTDYVRGSEQALSTAHKNYMTSHAGAFKEDGYNYVQSIIANSGISAARRYVHNIQSRKNKVSGLQATPSYMTGCLNALSNYDKSETL